MAPTTSANLCPSTIDGALAPANSADRTNDLCLRYWTQLAHDDPAQGTKILRRAIARQPLMPANLDPRQLHRQLRRRHSRVRQCPAIEATRQSWYVACAKRDHDVAWWLTQRQVIA
jgi:hypothetical protein